MTVPARRLLGLAACGLALPCLVIAPVAVDAAKPKSVKPKAGNYQGFARVFQNPKSIIFQVPSSRKGPMEVGLPGCSSSANSPRVRATPPMKAKISKKGKISGKATIRTRQPPEVPGPYEALYDHTLKISGRFKTKTRAEGKLSIKVTYGTVLKGTETPAGRGFGRTCNTGSVKWAAKRQ